MFEQHQGLGLSLVTFRAHFNLHNPKTQFKDNLPGSIRYLRFLADHNMGTFQGKIVFAENRDGELIGLAKTYTTRQQGHDEDQQHKHDPFASSVLQ